MKNGTFNLPGRFSLNTEFSFSMRHAAASLATNLAAPSTVFITSKLLGLTNRSSLKCSIKWVSTFPFSNSRWLASFDRKLMLVGTPATCLSKLTLKPHDEIATCNLQLAYQICQFNPFPPCWPMGLKILSTSKDVRATLEDKKMCFDLENLQLYNEIYLKLCQAILQFYQDAQPAWCLPY